MRENGQGFLSPGDLRRPPAPKLMGLRYRSPAPSPRPSPLLTAQPVDWACGLLGANHNPRSASEGPLRRGLVPQHRELGTPQPQRRTHPVTLPPPGPQGRCRSFRAGKRAGSSDPPATFEGFPRQNASAKLPLARALTSARPSARRTAGTSGLPASWGLTVTLGRPPRGHYQGSAPATPGIGDPQAPVPGSPCRPAPPGR